MSSKKGGREGELLRVATHLFREKGYHNTSMQDLASALDIQKASLYHYIESKEELLFRILDYGSRLLRDRVEEVRATDLPPAEKLRLALENHAISIMENIDLFSVFLNEYRNLSPPRRQQILEVRRQYEQAMMEILEEGIASGDFRPVDVGMTVKGLLGMLNWTHQWFSPNGPLSPQEIAATLVDLALYGVMARRQEAGGRKQEAGSRRQEARGRKQEG